MSGNALALTTDAEYWSEKQLAALRQIGVDNAHGGDLAVFHHVCQKTGLDPFARQIHMIERQGKWTIQTGIDGFRLVARRAVNATGETLSISAAEWCDVEGSWRDVWLDDDTYPTAARVTVYRNGEAFPAVAMWREYAQTKRDGNLTQMWATRGAGQLAKCAEALALRKAFPQDLAGIYTTDEFRDDAPHQPVRSAAASALKPEVEIVDGEIVDDEGQRKAMFAAFRDAAGFAPESSDEGRAERLAYISRVIGREVESSNDMSWDERSRVIDSLRDAAHGTLDGVTA